MLEGKPWSCEFEPSCKVQSNISQAIAVDLSKPGQTLWIKKKKVLFVLHETGGAGRHSHPPSRPLRSQQTPLLAPNTPARALNYAGAPPGGNLPGRVRLKVLSCLLKWTNFHGNDARLRTRRVQTSQPHRPPMVPTPIAAWRHRRQQIGSRSLCLTTRARAKTKEAYVYARTHMGPQTHIRFLFVSIKLEEIESIRANQQ